MHLIPAIVGPNASGKSALAIRIALNSRGEVVNLDSVQVYRGVYTGTGKLPPAEQRGVPHHLFDIIEPTENFTAGDYARLASEAIREVEARDRLAILAGGTGFYLRALVKPLFEGPRTDDKLREQLVALREKNGPEHLHYLLRRVDPQAALALKARDWPRTMRALEVYFQTGRRLSAVQSNTPPVPEFASRIRVIALSPPREEIYARIDERAEQWFEKGLVDEVEALIGSGVPVTAKVFQALGYRHALEYVRGGRSREDALNQMKLDTRHYAKRQLSWWRAWPGVKWIDRFGDEPEAFEEANRALTGDALPDYAR